MNRDNKVPRAAGMYAIRCNVTGQQYVGTSLDMRQRWALHRSQLRKGWHHCKPLQALWQEYGPDAFSFVTLEQLAPVTDRGAAEVYLYLLEKRQLLGPDRCRQLNATFTASPPKALGLASAGAILAEFRAFCLENQLAFRDVIAAITSEFKAKFASSE